MPKTLIEGFLKFHHKAYEGDDALMPQLVEQGQAPNYFIISCIDSRANPGTIFQAAPGTFFAHKAMGAIVRPYKTGTALAAALQFALIHNNVKNIIVLGHTGCGAVKAMIDDIEDPEISSFIAVTREALNKAQTHPEETGMPVDLQRHTEEQIVLLSAENLKTYPSVHYMLKQNEVTIKPWLFDMKEGDILEYSEDKGAFISLTEGLHINKQAECCCGGDVCQT